MNEKGTKKILFNKSSLLSLKAELIKKQEEVKEKKRLPQYKLENFKPPPPKAIDNDENGPKKEKKSFRDSLKAIDIEEQEAYKKTKLALEKKAALYEHLSNPIGESQLAGQFLVDFNTKKQQEPVPEADDHDVPDDLDYDDDDDSEWTEFTDCLGRTRKCLKSDVEYYRERDQELNRSMKKDIVNSDDIDVNVVQSKMSEKPFLVQKTNDYLQSLREKWELKEKELLAKEKDIHYQDLLFDEARLHGVSYFSFSTDETERQKQMEELIKIREETLRAQKEAEEKRRQQDDLIATRLKASRALQRVRAGLPAEDPEEAQRDFNECLLEFLSKQKQEADARAIEQEKKIKEELEKERQKLREAYVREWDRGKDVVEDKVKKFKELTQEEYVEQQRAKRLNEFAPLQSSSSSKANYCFDDKGQKVQVEEAATNKTWSDVRPKAKTPPPPDIVDLDEQKGLFFSTSDKIAQLNMKYKNFVKAQEVVPIVDELNSDECYVQQKPKKRISYANHTEIAPPPTYDYYGPVPKYTKFTKPFHSDMKEAFAQGTKSLETKSSNRQLPPQYDFSLG